MKLYTGNKNSPFALDVALDGSRLSYSVRPIMQREFVGDPTKDYSGGGKYFDQSLITEWRGDFGVFGESIYQRTLDLMSFFQHPEFSDHASFMLYAPVGRMERSGSSEGVYTQTPNLYVATVASKMDAQAYHASVLQTHPLGHILVPFRTSPVEDWSLGFNVFDPVLINAGPGIEVVPAITLALIREETLPVVRFVGGPSAEVPASEELSIEFRLETPEGVPITDRDAEVYLEATAGYLVSRRIKTVGGQGSQRFVARNDETNPEDVAVFMASLDSWVLSSPEAIEFWGGEPLVYIKTLRPLAEALRLKFPQARFSVITNGSLLNPQINQWLDDLGFTVSISHDGPGQHVRGPDPLEDPRTRQAILELYRRLAPQGRFSFNAMVNRSNQSRAAIQAFFAELTGDPDVMIGEGGFVDAYDDGGRALSLKPEEFHSFRRLAFQEIRQGKAGRISSVRDRTMSFVNSLRFKRPASSLGQKCGMDRSDSIAVDLKGNVLTCQNVSATAAAPNGESHCIGHTSQMQEVALKSATHWSHRKECPGCPVLQVCKGACMFLQGPLWDVSCDNAYSDALPIFAAGIEFLTGLVPVHIEGNLPPDRKDVFGFDGNSADGGVKGKPFPIPVVAA